ncbi:DUF4129 domain-containing protein [Pontibacter chitinilyticus]|uniref:DUF4129 domain-containing protein n=1 Tax=Pontibacter chitinilyticus TaxID=2674989 RepID=UPI00321BC7BF
MKANFKRFPVFILVLGLLFGLSRIACALPQDSIPAARQPVVVRQPDKETLAALQADKDFEYFEEVRPTNTFWERLMARLQHWLKELFYQGEASGFWELMIYLLITAAIAFVVIKMQHVDVGSLFGKKPQQTDTPYAVYEENIQDMDMAALLAEAIAQHDYRKAIRLHYLQSLKQLTELGLIHWKPGKTNRSYITEIQLPGIRQEFEQLTSMFEYVWYGGAGLGQELFASARITFQQFDALVKQQHA